jgi:hypothetical protein
MNNHCAPAQPGMEHPTGRAGAANDTGENEVRGTQEKFNVDWRA